MPKFKAVVKDTNGVVYTLSDNTYVGPNQPVDPSQDVWFDTSENNIKVCQGGYWHPIGAGSYVRVQSPTGMPAGYSVVEVDCSQLSADSTYTLSFAEVPPAGSVTHIIILPNVAGGAVFILVPCGLANPDWINGTGDTACLPISSGWDTQSDPNGGLVFRINPQAANAPVHVTAISNGNRVYFSIDDIADPKI